MRSGYDMDKKLHNPTYINVQRTYWWQLQLINSKIASEIMSERKGEFLDREGHLKSNNLQYNTLGRWVDRTNDSSTKRVMFQALFIISYILRALKTLYSHFCNCIKRWIERVFAKNFARFYEKKIILGTSDAWFVPSARRTIIINCKLTDFWSLYLPSPWYDIKQPFFQQKK